MSKFKIGDKVRYIGREHDNNSQWFPSISTIGTVVEVVDEIDCYIQWPKGSTSKEDRWYCNKNDIKLVGNVDMTNEEIWEMLYPKLVKNGLDWIRYGYDADGNEFYYVDETVLKNAVAIAYKSGYYRSQKGRPFKFGEKKKKGGHWVPVDPNNLPKEGTRVKYARECATHGNDVVKIGDEGIVEWDGVYAPNWFGVKFDNPRSWMKWFCFDEEEDCLDMWVEDDE